MEGDQQNLKQKRAKYLIAGAVLGAALGLLIKNVFVGSSIGILAAVVVATRKEGEAK